MYIDTSNIEEGRVCLNALMADQLRTARNISLTGDASGSASFNGTADAEINVDIPALDDLGEAIDTKATKGHGIYYGTCATAAGTKAKVATLTDATGFSLATGSVVIIKFTNKNSIASPTLNVNGTGAKTIRRYGTSNVSTGTTTNGWNAGSVCLFVYDGTYWIETYWYNTTYSQASLGQGYGICETVAETTEKVVTLSSYALAVGGIVSVKFTNAVPASATMNINGKGAKPIFHKGVAIKANIIYAEDIATFIYDGTQYHLIALDDLTLADMGITATKENINILDGTPVTSVELSYLSGVTSSIQSQFNNLEENKLDKTANAASASKLNTARKIKLTNDATGEVSFDGTKDVSIAVEIPDLDTLGESIDTINKSLNKEAYLAWGGRNLSGSVSPVDAASSYLHSANRFQFAKPAGITVEYSRDNGSTFTNYDISDNTKIRLVSGNGASLYIGQRSGTSSSVTVNTIQDQLRVTLHATNMGVYTRLRKLLININTNYSKGCKLKIEKAMKGSETTFTAIGTYDISGWSGWNSIPIDAPFGGGSNQTSNIAILRLTFSITSITAGNYNNALTLLDILGIGDTYWAYPSNMAKTGHLYSWDASQNASFPADVSVTNNLDVSGTGSITGNATIGGTLGVTGAATFTDIITAGADIASDGSISAEGSIHAEGDISTPNATIEDNGYITGTWLRTTAATNATGDIATLKDGQIYYRTPAQILNDIIEADGTLDLNAATDTPLVVISDAAATSYIQYKDKNATSLGYIGFSAANTPAVYLNAGAKEIYHKGNLSLSSLGITATKEEINILDGTPVTSVELSYLSGVTSSIQTQINNLNTNKLNKTANAVSASKWASAMTLELSGDATGSASFDGSTKTTLNVEISALNNFVPLGGGTMTGNLFIQGTNPYIGFKNSTGVTKGYVQYIQSSDSYAIGAGSTNSLVINSTGSITIPEGQTFTPVTTNTGTIGTSDKKWNAMYATTFDGNATSATKATQDGDGNTISSTYLKLTGGTLTGNLSILTGDTDKFIIWDYSTSDNSKGASWRIGELGTGSSNANYFVIQTTGSTTGTTETYTNAMQIGMNNKDVTFYGDVTSNKFIGSLQGNASTATTLQTARTINGMTFNGSANITNYGVCSTAAATAEKAVTVNSTFVLAEGAQVVVKFTYANTAASPKLNVNGTGAKSIMQYGTTAAGTTTATTGWIAGAVQTFTYDGTNWVRDYWYNTTYTTRPISQTVADDDAEYPLLSRTTTAVTTSNGHAKFVAGVTVNPSTKTITATTFAGNATSASKLAAAVALTVGSTSKNFDGSGAISWSHAEIGATVSNTVAANTTSGPSISTTVNGVTGTAVQIPSASASASGVITIGDQTLTGNKTLQNATLIFKNTTATPAAGTILPCIKGSYQNGDGTYYTINMLDLVGTAETTNAYSAYVRVGSSSGATFVTSGESSLTMPAAITASGGGSENLYLTSDGTIDFFVSCANDATSYTNAFTMTASKVTSHVALYGAVWNDYAEYRDQTEKIEPGYCVVSADNGQVSKTTEKLQVCDGIVSDTFGFAIGETDECKTPLAVAGRVLAYCEGNRYDYHAGDTVCAGPEGKVCKMTREEIREWPDRIIGTVSEIPEYEVWGTGKVKVNGRIWIKIR